MAHEIVVERSPKLNNMPFAELDSKIDEGVDSVAALIPYLTEMRTRLYSPGKRSDLYAPKGLTWTAWVASKKDRLNMSLRRVQYLLALPDQNGEPHAKVASGWHKRNDPSPLGCLGVKLNALISNDAPLSSSIDSGEHALIVALEDAVERSKAGEDKGKLESICEQLGYIANSFNDYAKRILPKTSKDEAKPKKPLDEDGRYSRLHADVIHLYNDVSPDERRAMIHKHADQLKEDF